MQTYHTKLQTTVNELEIDDSQFEKVHSRFSANQTGLQNTLRASHTTDIKFRTTDIKFRSLQTKFQRIHTKLRTNNTILRIQIENKGCSDCYF